MQEIVEQIKSNEIITCQSRKNSECVRETFGEVIPCSERNKPKCDTERKPHVIFWCEFL